MSVARVPPWQSMDKEFKDSFTLKETSGHNPSTCDSRASFELDQVVQVHLVKFLASPWKKTYEKTNGVFLKGGPLFLYSNDWRISRQSNWKGKTGGRKKKKQTKKKRHKRHNPTPTIWKTWGSLFYLLGCTQVSYFLVQGSQVWYYTYCLLPEIRLLFYVILLCMYSTVFQ